MKCQYCSTNNPDNEVSCVKCGAPLEHENKSDIITLREGESRSFSFHANGSLVHSPEMRFYKKGSLLDVSATYFEGTMSISGNTIRTKKSCNLKAGEWVLSVFANVGGDVQEIKTIPVVVHRRSTIAT